MRILQLHNHYREPGGEDAVVSAERTLLEGAGHEVVSFERTNPIGVTATSSSLLAAPWNPVTALQVRQLVRAHKPSVAHVHNTWFSLSPSVLEALHREGVPTVMTIHNYRLACINGQLLRQGKPCQICVGTHPWNGVRYRCYRDSVASSAIAAATISLNRLLGTWKNRVDRFLVLTDFMKEILERSGLPASRIDLTPNFVDDPGPRPSLPGQSNTVLFVGRLAPEKGIDVLLRAWERSKPPGLNLEVVGDGPMLAMLRKRAIAGVSFRGLVPREEVRRLMLTSRALAFPSIWYEGQPMVILEALAAGLPVFASDLGGTAETLGQGGVVVDSWASFSFTEWPASALNAIGLAGRRQWENRFTPHLHLENLLSSYGSATYSKNSGS
ncbi:MAG TPA: glycosyltransferase family 4 protein [Acidimicrobiia bacterium]|nr:glycosyltransferase family 4 protein [Acidimicrobiia bacterium]